MGAVQLSARGVHQAAQALQESQEAIVEAASRGAELVLLPECSWPGYAIGSGWRELWATLPPQEAVLGTYSRLAREHRIVLVAGLALRHGDTLHNVAVVWDRDGTEAGRAAKRFLWDFDTRCFTAGTASSIIETSVGRLGIMVCADGRMPEIACLLTIGGAEVLLDPTAWVTSQADPSRWSNPQYEFMLPTRARENGLWAVAANKVGIERDAVAYCGRSCVLDREGGLVAAAPPDAPAVLVEEIELADPRPPATRRPELYGALVQRVEDMPVSAALHEPLVPSQASGRVAVDALARPMSASDASLLADLGVALFVSPRGLPEELAIPRIIRTDPDRAVLHGRAGVIARWERTHGPSAPGSQLGPVVDSPLGRVTVLLGEDGLLPEPARVLMLEGAELVVWFPGPDDDVLGVGSTRAAENRLNVVLAASPGARTPSAVLDPDGRVLTSAGHHERLLHAVLALADVRRKEMAPGTDVVVGRQPDSYRPLVATAATGPRASGRHGRPTRTLDRSGG